MSNYARTEMNAEILNNKINQAPIHLQSSRCIGLFNFLLLTKTNVSYKIIKDIQNAIK